PTSSESVKTEVAARLEALSTMAAMASLKADEHIHAPLVSKEDLVSGKAATKSPTQLMKNYKDDMECDKVVEAEENR
ncbi:hypothetical protein NP570_25785, partial [Vibrio parahaemolyticus]|nr:hypothetical protein [Vibrio parahaemolyticus]